MTRLTRTLSALVLAGLIAGACAGSEETDERAATSSTTPTDRPSTTSSAPPPTTTSATTTTTTTLPDVVPLDLPGATALPDQDIMNLSVDLEPGTYLTSRLGTEIGITFDRSVSLGAHETGTIGFDADRFAGTVTAILRPEAVRGPRLDSTFTDEPTRVDVADALDTLIAGDEVDGALVGETVVDGRSTVIYDVAPPGDGPDEGDVDPAINFGTWEVTLDQTHRIWVIDQDGWTPIVVTAPTFDPEWLATTETVVASLHIGTPVPPEWALSDAPWLYGFFAIDVEPGRHPAAVLGGLEVDVPEPVGVPPYLAQRLTLHIGDPGNRGTVTLVAPDVEVDPASLVPILVLPGPTVENAAQLVALLDRAESLSPVDAPIEVLGTPATVHDFVAGEHEVALIVERASAWQGAGTFDLPPLTEGRVWTVDTERGPLLAVAYAEVGRAEPLARAIALAEHVLESATFIELDG